VLGVVIIVFVLVIALPMLFIMSGAAVAAILGTALKQHGELSHEGSELVDLNR
jgi:hypothetical protein